MVQNRIQLGIDHVKIRHGIHDLVVHIESAGILQISCQIRHFLGMGIVVADQILHHHQQFFQRSGVFRENVLVLLFPVNMGMGQTAVGMGHCSVMGMSQRIPLHTADLIHSAVGNHDLHIEVGIKQLFQAVSSHQTVGYLAGGTLVMAVDGLPALAVGNGQAAIFLQKTRQNLDQTLGLGKMGKGIVDHNPVKLFVKLHFLHIAADDLHPVFGSKFTFCNFGHFRRNINTGDGSGSTVQIVREHNTGAAGHIQNILTGCDFYIVQNFINHCIVFDHVRIPAGGHAVKEFNHILFVHRISS